MKKLPHRARIRKQKEYFTFMFLPGPSARLRTISISKSFIKSAMLSLVAVALLSLYLLYAYNDMKQKIQRYEENLAPPAATRVIPAEEYVENIVTYIFIIVAAVLFVRIILLTVRRFKIARNSVIDSRKEKLICDFLSALDRSSLNPLPLRGDNESNRRG